MILDGSYQPPLQAARQATYLRLGESGDSLTLGYQGQEIVYSLSVVEISAALGSIPITLTFPDGGRFTASESAPLTAWLAQHGRHNWLHRLERNKWSLVGALLVTVLCVLFYLQVLLPQATVFLAKRLPDSVHHQVGTQTLYLLDKGILSTSQLPEARQQELQQLFQQIMPAELQQDSVMPKLLLRHSGQPANAFMLADGSLILTDELVALATNDQQLAAVMLHEMGHHHQRHLMQTVVRSSLLTVTSAWLIGDASTLSDGLINTGMFAVNMRLSRTMEREADRYAIEEMRTQRRPLQEMLTIYQALEGSSGEDESVNSNGWASWLSTHPNMQERLDSIQAAVTAHP